MEVKLSLWPALLAVVTLILQPGKSYSSNILALFPFSSRSHNNLYSIITKALAEKGHSLTVISSQPLECPPSNFRQIDFHEEMKKHLTISGSPIKGMGMFEILSNIKGMTDDICRKTLFHPEVNKLLNQSSISENFDLILTTTLYSECFYGFAHIHKAPLILISPPGPLDSTYSNIGIVGLPSFIANAMYGFSDHMTFSQRIINTLVAFGHSFYYKYFVLSSVDSIMKEAYGKEIPSFSEVKKYVSLILVNHHFSLNGARPLAPNIIEIGGLHIKSPKELPQEIKQFMDGANEHGVIYVSFGSILKSANFPIEIRNAFIEAFSKLKQRVLWKWEGVIPLPGQTENVRLEKWLPQQDVLAHPNVRIFITHGGLLSMQESASRGVPLIGIPCVGDQFTNLQRAVDLQIGVKLDPRNLTKESILGAIDEVLGNPKYKQNMKDIKSLVEDQKDDILERAIFWIEYVMRHKGAKHMRLSSAELAWYQLYMLDVFFVLVVMPVFIISMSVFIIIKFNKKKCSSPGEMTVSSKKRQ
ncbi:UDP-glycosyltransferase [Ladona fulva]|uniref:UDP-glycosyltransferase n=1 Tax=Ladona fulva TaxID=123851 RepID=A0A8K0P0U9_LADFU|nr:UDP-glycosyltransferase [Ladona fulva]